MHWCSGMRIVIVGLAAGVTAGSSGARANPTMERAERPSEHAEAVAAAARQASGVILVVDHQLSLPMLIKALGGPTIPTLCDVEFSNLYVLVLGSGDSARLVDAHYGAPDRPHGPGCKITPRSPR